MNKQPHIEVRIKPRAKDHPSDDFKVVVTYQVCLSKEEQENLIQLVPSTPRVDLRQSARLSATNAMKDPLLG